LKPICLHDKKEIESFLRQNEALHLYEIGDLDDFFWQYTTWYALREQEQTKQLVLLYTGITPPTMLALTEDSTDGMRELLRSIVPFLPRQFYAHLSGNLAAALETAYQVQPHGVHYKMTLINQAYLNEIDTSAVIPLTVAERPELEAFYQHSYPGNWFDARMLETGQYYGLRRGGILASVAGIHVYSPQYKVATLGNIATHPDFRGQGLATAVCARLCRALLTTVATIGLNVKANNSSAIACYQKLGFERVAEYGEYSLTLK
jgi:ribosomal protein S18 acetylase RimI-like enzyme